MTSNPAGTSNRSTPLVAWLLAASLLASGCSLFGSETGEDAAAEDLSDGMQWFSEQDCAGMTLPAGQAVPLEPVEIQGWPDPGGGHHGAVVARILDGDELTVESDVEALADEALVTVFDWHEPVALPAPVHPSGDVTGGSVQLEFGQIDGEEARWCGQAHELQVAPLPAAEADQGLTPQLELLDEILDTLLEPSGIDGRALAGQDRGDLDGELVPAYVLATLLHADGGLHAQASALSGDDLELADRLMARIQTDAAAELPTEVELDSPASASPDPDAETESATEPAQELESLGAPAHTLTPAATPARHLGSAPTAKPVTWTPGTSFLAAAAGAGEGCTPAGSDTPGTDQFAALTQMLGRQVSGDTMAGGNTGFTIDAAMFVGGLPVIGRVGLPTVLTAWGVKFAAEYLQGMMPSQWERTQFDFDPHELWEDDTDGGHIDAITMQFRSQGWDMGPILAELAMIVAGEVAGKAISQHRYSPRLDPADFDELVEHAFREAEEEATEFLIETALWVSSTVLGEAIDTTGISAGALEFAPRCWEARAERPDLPESLRTHYLGAIEEGDRTEHFVARDLGTGLVEARWELPIGASILGVGLSQEVRDAEVTFGASGEVEVRSLGLAWQPQRRQVEPGEYVELELNAKHAHDGRVRVTDSLGLLDRELDASGVGALVDYRVPDDWDGTPIAVVAVSLSETGLRNPSHPSYRGEIERVAWLTSSELYVTPMVSCVEEGSTTRFEATDQPLGGDAVAVRWTADGGSITSEGVFTAPSRPREVTITATAVDDPDMQVSVVLTVGDCNQCSWSATITGDLWETGEWRGSGNTILADRLDWETGAFESLHLGHGLGERDIWLTNATPGPSAAPSRPMFVSHSVPKLHRYTGDWHAESSGGASYGRGPGEVQLNEGQFRFEPPVTQVNWTEYSLGTDPGWELSGVPNLNPFGEPGQLQDVHIPEHPTLELQAEFSGQVLVGVATELRGQQVAMASVEHAPILGTITVQLSATIRPDWADLMLRGGAQELGLDTSENWGPGFTQCDLSPDRDWANRMANHDG